MRVISRNKDNVDCCLLCRNFKLKYILLILNSMQLNSDDCSNIIPTLTSNRLLHLLLIGGDVYLIWVDFLA